jgi:dipeptidase E
LPDHYDYFFKNIFTMRLIIASTSTVYGSGYLTYIENEIKDFFAGAENILFVPFARPSGISHDEYTENASSVFSKLGYNVRGAHSFSNPAEAVSWADGFFTGGGNTFLLLKMLYETGFFGEIDVAVRGGKPYMGTSAGCNMTGLSMGTTNDMPIVYPPSFKTFGWVPFNLNPHYLDPQPGNTHMGETRETRIAEFHQFNPQPVMGLREGSWLRVENGQMELKGPHTARWFLPGKPPVELGSGLLNGLI